MSRSPLITWSPSVTLVPTRVCFNACGYCSFRRSPAPGELAGDGPLSDGLDAGAARVRLKASPAAREVLLLSGELPPGSRGRGNWFARLRSLSALALAAGRLPHTNAGPLSLREMSALGRLNPSLGLMLEGLGPAYDALHRQAPSKRLAVRLGQLEQAGRLGIPFTTGLLLGVGESAAQRRDALELIALLQRRWGHIQEVILQPWRPDGTTAAPLPPEAVNALLSTIAEARRILPPEVHLQLPPNLWPADRLVEALEAGIDDLGGIDTGDVINPAYPQPPPPALAERLALRGWRLRPRLCVHDRWIPWLPAPLRRRAEAMAQQLAAAG
ncbi:7,8-didemethyl-8-hydroxy-5-deazariboflavin synthase subunit CofG [Cyanobium sp. CH-040]|uniref:7,8-didemethyl-8-hydroxy-5-deazariboflavin synthase subunit CofG n=1 Tax=Cyanobium sp. CH-040 TaxID=2823708 RepID=UPI0020CF6BAA|nr:7,8-didemethyl-8-hydroxy-5-deazariboflavin synthase subunit CofG [Cyanobium sp. CH-040]MCP9928585.1 7,8-didemethyl-8-hydroxy-5-deazariboflavin synthase subunit CofG [Cyanobium sp. CH-040]